MFSLERLILEVQSHECLWNTDDRNFSNTHAKERAWFDIAKVFNENWNELKQSAKIKRVDMIISKWRKLKDSYEYYNNPDFDCGLVKNRKPKHYDKLKFLDTLNRPSTFRPTTNQKTNTNKMKTKAQSSSRQFLMSLLPAMEKMDEDQNMKFRISVMKLIGKDVRRNSAHASNSNQQATSYNFPFNYQNSRQPQHLWTIPYKDNEDSDIEM